MQNCLSCVGLPGKLSKLGRTGLDAKRMDPTFACPVFLHFALVDEGGSRNCWQGMSEGVARSDRGF